MSALMPQSIGIFTAILKREGFDLDLFDCTYYKDIDAINLGKNAQEEKSRIEMLLFFLMKSLTQRVLLQNGG